MSHIIAHQIVARRTPGNCGTKRFRSSKNANVTAQIPSVTKSHDQICVKTQDTKENIPSLFKVCNPVRSGS